MTLNCDKIYNIHLSFNEDEYEDINRALEEFYSRDVEDDIVKVHEKLWELKDLLTVAVKG